MKIPPRIDPSGLTEDQYASAMVAAAFDSAYGYSIENAIDPIDNVESVDGGLPFTIPLLAPEGVESGDGRIFSEGALSTRILPLPLFWQPATDSGHDSSYIVGRIDSIDRIAGGLGNAKGVFDVGGPYGREAARLVRSGFLRGISVDLDKFEASAVEEPEVAEADILDTEQKKESPKPKQQSIKNQRIVITAGRIMGATLVGKPAFESCFIVLDKEPTLDFEEPTLEDGIHEEISDDPEYELSSVVASAAPMIPPRAWFADPKLQEPTPLTVTDDGKVFGHIAAWSTSHIGRQNVKPPRSASKYAYFRTGLLRTDEGDVQVGQLTLAGGHAPLQASAQDAIKHYDDTNSSVADVVAGEDQFGIWVSGALRPDVTPSQVRAFRASAPSGDWRPINGRLELVAVCAVNVPGFPIARAITASGGVPGALVAAGAAYLAELRETSQMADLEARIKKVEDASLADRASDARSRMSAVLSQRNAELSARAEAARARMCFTPRPTPSDVVELSAKALELREKFKK